MTRRWWASAALAVLTLAMTARADPPALGDDPDVEIARRHFQRGSELYVASDYVAALEEFKKAEQFRAAPELEYNIARCYDRMERPVEALAAYERYAALAPGSPEVEARIAILRKRIAEAQPPPAAAPPATAPPVAAAPAASPRRSGRALVAPLVVGGVAVAALGAGLGLYLATASRYHEVQDGCPVDCPESRWGTLRSQAYASYALFGVAAAAAVVDVALWVRWARRPAARTRALARPAGVL